MRFRFAEPDALFLVDLLIRLGEIGAFDLEGSLRKIGTQIGELLGDLPDSSRLYRGMRALAGRTCLVERVSRQIWRLALAGITDPASPRHRRLLDETPSPCHLEIAEHAEVRAALPVPEDPHLIDGLRDQLERRAAEAQGIADERDVLKVELVVQHELADRLVAELDGARRGRDEAVRAERAQAERLSSELRRFEDVLLERDIKIEDLERQLASGGTAPAAETPAAEVDKLIALKATLKAERERRRSAETRLRQVLSALRVKLDAGPGPEPVAAIDLDRVLWDSLSQVLVEQLDALEAEDELDGAEPGRAEERQVDVDAAEAILLRVPRGSRGPRSSGR